MAVFCSECGEELLGTVNRCWNCGREFELLADSAAPPVRRAPLGEIIVAQPADDPPDGSAQPSSTAAPSTGPTPTAPSSPAAEVRRGSPFAGSGPGIALRTPIRPQYPTGSAARGAAFASVVVGIIAVISSFYTIGGIIIGIVGLFMGTWGLYSDRRAVAILGTVLSCIALAIACFYGAVYLYILVYGIDPFAPEVPEMEFPF